MLSTFAIQSKKSKGSKSRSSKSVMSQDCYLKKISCTVRGKCSNWVNIDSGEMISKIPSTFSSHSFECYEEKRSIGMQSNNWDNAVVNSVSETLKVMDHSWCLKATQSIRNTSLDLRQLSHGWTYIQLRVGALKGYRARRSRRDFIYVRRKTKKVQQWHEISIKVETKRNWCTIFIFLF